MNQRIIVAIGPALGGKSTLCKHIAGYETFSFASPLYDMLSIVAGPQVVDTARRNNEKSEPLEVLCGKSLRQGLQTLGTEWGRELIGEDVWVEHLLRRSSGFPRIAIDDLRFPNEYNTMLNRGAIFVRLLPYAALRKDGWQGHVSESHWRLLKVHAELRWDKYEQILEFAEGFNAEKYYGVAPTL
jgi:hypothetical protein